MNAYLRKRACVSILVSRSAAKLAAKLGIREVGATAEEVIELEVDRLRMAYDLNVKRL